MAGGLAASSPLTWHVVLGFAGAGRDHVEDVRGPSVGGAVGSLSDAARQLRAQRAGGVFAFFFIRASGNCGPGVLPSESCTDTNVKINMLFKTIYQQV